ncbi:hypothetical protein JKP88DRAFT_159936 [Tribonema minus]|uniref:Ankyrin repeat domain containing protein n=1 Tax=Tribonema minus TaxID=303371 RepID=A0A835ZF97_9STRA|nr:hypothetical protein JKP88DRAFT_159936 [Tribonema minus]
MVTLVPLAQWAVANGCCVRRLLKHAAACGSLEVLQHWANASPWSDRVGTKLCAAAVEGGHFHVLQWLHTINCPWDASTPAAAARRGDLTLVQWLHAERCPWDKSACCEAAEGGHLEVLKYLFEQGCPWNGKVCCRAARSGHLSTLHDTGESSDIAFTKAAIGGHLELMQWAYIFDCPVNLPRSISTAAEHGHLSVILWLRSISRDWSSDAEYACDAAARGDQLATLQWLHQNGCPLDPGLCSVAARCGNVEMLEWARSMGCPWHNNLIIYASKPPHHCADLSRKRLAAVEWALANGCPCNAASRSAYLRLQREVRQSLRAASARNCVEA